MPERSVRLRIAEPGDAEALLAVYAPYVRDTAVTYEYEVPTVQAFAQRIRSTLENYPYLAAEADGEIVGYAYAGRFHPRAAYDWSAETTIYMKDGVKRGGLGRRLYGALERILAMQHVLNVNACIAYPPAEDEYLTYGSAAFHRRMGYRMVGQFHQCGYKFGRWYGMAWMEKQLAPHPEVPEPFLPFPAVREAAEAVCRES